MGSNKITILAENYASQTSLSEWGFSALIEFEKKKYLFDVGYSGTCVLRNAEELNIELKDIDGIILSHGHYDHANGLTDVLDYVGPTLIYAHPTIFRDRYSLKDGKRKFSGINISKEQLEKQYGVTFKFSTDLSEICTGLFTTGEVPFSNNFEKISDHFKVNKDEMEGNDDFPDDNSVVIETSKGLIVVCGCAHRGIVNILTYVKKKFGKNIYGIIGGTHLYNVTNEHFDYVVDFIRQEQIELLAPGHCTGIKRIHDLRNIFGDKVTPSFCGEKFNFS